MHHPVQLLVFTLLSLWTLPLTAVPESIAPDDPQPLRAILAGTPVADIADDGPVLLPILNRSGDIATILANGGQARTQEGSIFSEAKLDFQLAPEEPFPNQLRNYLAGKSPYLRGTAGMISMAAEALSQDPRTKPVVVYQMSWSTGADALVVKPGITSVKSLKGKTIALQRHGPHADFMARLLEDAGLGVNDVRLLWVSNPSGNDSTVALFQHDNVDAAFVTAADAVKLTSVGNASGGAAPPARLLLSTRTASRVVADLYAVRNDYLKSHRKEVQQFVHALLKAAEALQSLVAAGEGSDYAQLLSNAARLMGVGKPGAHVDADIENLLAGSELAGWQGNVNLFAGQALPGSLDHITAGMESAFIAMGLLDTRIPPADAGWDYARLREGLSLGEVAPAQRFNPHAVALSMARRQRLETLHDRELFSVELYFSPNQQSFPDDIYQDAFNKVVDYLSAYRGALITIEGHSDPLGYLLGKSSGMDSQLLGRIKQSARNSSLSHAATVRDSIIGFAQAHGVAPDPGRFAILGHGISRPVNGVCGSLPCIPASEQEWRDNMRVKVRILQAEAEPELFNPRTNPL